MSWHPSDRFFTHLAQNSPGFEFRHEETDTGGTKFPRRVDMTAHHPETGGEAGSARYYPPKRKGGVISVEEVRGHAPGAASALLNEIESRHPGSSTKFLYEVKRNNNNPDVTGHAHENAGKPSDWDTHYPNISPTIYRGMSVRLPDRSARVVNSASPKENHLTELHDALSQSSLGTHWTEDEASARLFAEKAVSDHRTDIPVVVHAQSPARKDIETREQQLYRGGVFPYGDPHSKENEIPYRKGRNVSVTGMSWKPDAAHPDADERGWIHHSYDQDAPQHRASLHHAGDQPATGEFLAQELPHACSYCGHTDFEAPQSTGRGANATCKNCGGTMTSWGGQWMPELIGDPSNHPSPKVDPRSGAGFGRNDYVDYDGRENMIGPKESAFSLFEVSHTPEIEPDEVFIGADTVERKNAAFTYRQTVQGPTGYADEERTIEGPLYHGGRANLRPGDHLTVGRKPNSWGDEGPKSTHNYFTSDMDTAASYARDLGRRGRVYEVEPTGEFKKDYGPHDYKTPHPLRVVREISQHEWPDWAKHGARAVPSGKGPVDWDTVGAIYPHLYGDPEVHGEAAEGSDGWGIGDAANHLAHDRAEDPGAESTSVHDLGFHPHKEVPTEHIDYVRHPPSDPRVAHAIQGYKTNPDKVPPLVLVHRHGVYHVADGHHRAAAAAYARVNPRALVAFSPHPDEPFSDGGRGPFHGAELTGHHTAMPKRQYGEVGDVAGSHVFRGLHGHDPHAAADATLKGVPGSGDLGPGTYVAERAWLAIQHAHTDPTDDSGVVLHGQIHPDAKVAHTEWAPHHAVGGQALNDWARGEGHDVLTTGHRGGRTHVVLNPSVITWDPRHYTADEARERFDDTYWKPLGDGNYKPPSKKELPNLHEGAFSLFEAAIHIEADGPEQDYRMQHQAPDSDYGAPLHDVENIMPDFYTHPHYYDHGQEHLHESISKIFSARGNPEKKVRVYRALPAEHAHKGFNTGDWVSTSKSYARDHARVNSDPKHDWPVISAMVPAKHLHTEGDVHEWAYNGPSGKWGMVSFKGGYHQEVRHDKDGNIVRVKRRPKKEDPLKGFDIQYHQSDVGTDTHAHHVFAYDEHDNYAGRLHAKHGEEPYDVHVEPHLEGGPLEQKMRDKIPHLKQGSKTASVDWCAHRRQDSCYFPGDHPVPGQVPQRRGACNWTTAWEQQLCPMSDPGPMAGMFVKGTKEADYTKQNVGDGWKYESPIVGETRATTPDGTTHTFPHWLSPGIKQVRHQDHMPVPLYHGTSRAIPEGSQIEPGHPGNFVKRMKHVYMVDNAEEARKYAGPNGHVYQVQPTGWYGHRADAKGHNWATEFPVDIVGIHSGPQTSREAARQAGLLPVKQAGYKGFVEAYQGYHKTAEEMDSRFDDREPDNDPVAQPVAEHGPLINFIGEHIDNTDLWHHRATVTSVPLHQGVYATQPYVVDRHLERYVANPADQTHHVQLHGDSPAPQDQAPMFVRHGGNIFTIEGHHRTAAALQRGDTHIRGYLYDADQHGWPDNEAEAFPVRHHTLHHYAGRGVRCAYAYDDPTAALGHAIMNHDDGICVATEVHGSSLGRHATLDPEVRLQFTATWADVRDKAKRIRREGGVRILMASTDGIVGEVRGDHQIYETQLTYVPGTSRIGSWNCGCAWASYAWGRSPQYRRFEGRRCSHALALQYEAQSRGAHGRTISPDVERPDWLRAHTPITVQHQRDPSLDLKRREVPPGNMRKVFSAWEVPAAGASLGPVCTVDGGPTQHTAVGVDFHQLSLVNPDAKGAVYLRFGHWPKDERSANNITGFREDGVSVYDLDHRGEPKDPDPDMNRGHYHDEHCEPDCDLDTDNDDYGNDTLEEMQGRVHRAERDRANGRHSPANVPHLVKGDMVGIGHDGEPLLRNVKRVGDWIDHRHLLFPEADRHPLARDEHDEGYEPPNPRGRKLSSLICPECHGAVAPSATTCPHCGAALTPSVVPEEHLTARLLRFALLDDPEHPGWVAEAERGERAKGRCTVCRGRGHHLDWEVDEDAAAKDPDNDDLPMRQVTNECDDCDGRGWNPKITDEEAARVRQRSDEHVRQIDDEHMRRHLQLHEQGRVPSRSWCAAGCTDTRFNPGYKPTLQDITGAARRQARLRHIALTDDEDFQNKVQESHQGKRSKDKCTTCRGKGHNMEWEVDEEELAKMPNPDVAEPPMHQVAHECDDCDGRGWWPRYTAAEEQESDERRTREKQERHEQAAREVDRAANEKHARERQEANEHLARGEEHRPGVCPRLCPERVRQEIAHGAWPDRIARQAGAKEPEGPSVSGVALKALDTGRVLMLQRGLEDEKDPARGTWEFPGGHHEDGDLTSLHAAIREWEEEVGQPFPEGGVVHHTWTSPNGIYQGHVVVVPSEKDLSMRDGRVIPNPDDPKGDHHEQAAWWDIAHAKKNPALRPELKSGTPWKELENAGGSQKGAARINLFDLAFVGDLTSNGPLKDFAPYVVADPPAHSMSTNPASTGFATSEDPTEWENPPSTREDVYARTARQTQEGFDAWRGRLWQGLRDHGTPVPKTDHLYRAVSNDEMAAAHQQGGFKPLMSTEPGVYVTHDPDRLAGGAYGGKNGGHIIEIDPSKVTTHPAGSRYIGGVDETMAEHIPLHAVTRSWTWDDAAKDHLPSAAHHTATLHAEPEPALPSTDGEREDPLPVGTPAPITDTETMPHGYDDLTEFREDHPDLGISSESALALNGSPGSETPVGSSVADIVADFQRTAGAQALLASNPKENDVVDIADAARAYLAKSAGGAGTRKTALKDFSFSEQQALIGEGGDHVTARNLPDLQIQGTHYEALEAALAAKDDDLDATDLLI